MRCKDQEVVQTLVLTGDPVVVQLALAVLLFGAQCLEGQLQLLPVQRVLNAKLLWGGGGREREGERESDGEKEGERVMGRRREGERDTERLWEEE